MSLQPAQQRFDNGYGASHGGSGYGGGDGTYCYDHPYAPRMPGATTTHATMAYNMSGGGVIRIHARWAKIAGALKATSDLPAKLLASAGGAIWVTTENDLKLVPGAILTVKAALANQTGRGGGGGRIALARYLKPEELAALTANGDTLPEGRFASKSAKYVFDYAAFTNRFPSVSVDISGAPLVGEKGNGTFYFLDGKSDGLLLLVR